MEKFLLFFLLLMVLLLVHAEVHDLIGTTYALGVCLPQSFSTSHHVSVNLELLRIGTIYIP